MTNTDLADWIAINIMGWKKEKKYGTPPYGILYWVDESLDYKWVKPAQGWGHWYPPESISDAFRVVEKMRTSYFKWFEMAHRPNGFTCNFSGDPRHTEFAETAPLAICLAVKKAIEEMG